MEGLLGAERECGAGVRSGSAEREGFQPLVTKYLAELA